MPGIGTGTGAGRGAPAWRELQATTVVHRLARLVRAAPRVHQPVSRRAPAGRGRPARSGPVTPAGLVSPLRAPATPVTAPAAPPDELAAVLGRARTAGTPLPAVAALAEVWAGLGPAERRGVARPLGGARPGPLRVGGVPARQTDPTTCGSAVLALLAAQGDPVLALWLATGRLVPGYLPPELRAMPAAEVTSADPAVRFGGLQRVVKRATNRRALGPLPWPPGLGTPPWGAARTARFGGVPGWTHVLVDDADTALVDAVLDRADAALATGVPVPLFTGGDLGGGPAAAVPRHVVLLVPGARAGARPGDPAGARTDDGPDDRPEPERDDGYAVYEPGSARVVRVTRRELVRPGGPHPALGGWSHVCWAVLPR